jgi:hypothetical protein
MRLLEQHGVGRGGPVENELPVISQVRFTRACIDGGVDSVIDLGALNGHGGDQQYDLPAGAPA